VTSTAAAKSGSFPLAAVRAVPVWVWLVGLVALSVVVRYGFARRTVAPWIMVDELIYSELGKNFAESGNFLIRGEDVGGAYGVVYPVLISPAFALFGSIPDAYGAAKAINALLISLAAVPAYFLARRVLSAGASLLAAGLAIALPSMLYAGTLMTENAFYPVFLCAALALVLVLERPTGRRIAVLLAVSALAFATRAQAAVLVPAMLTAPLLLVAFRRRPWRALMAYRWLYVPVLTGLVLYAGVQALRGRSPLAALGAYRVAGEERYDVGEVARWFLYHVGELDLALGVAPFLALLLLLLGARRLAQRDQAFLAAAVALSGWLVLVVAAFASRHSLRVEERNMFYVAPLFLIALLLWIERGLPRPPILSAAAAWAAAVLPALLPFASLIGVSAVSDTFGLLPWWTVHEWGVPLDRLWIVVLAAGALVTAFMLVVTQPWGLALPAFVLAFFAASVQPVEERIRGASIGSLFQGITRPDRNWIDRAVGADSTVAAVYSGRLDHLTVLENEFFSRAVGPVYTLDAAMPGGLEQTPLTPERRGGLLLDPGGNPVRAPYALVDDSVPLAGRTVARDERKGLAVLRVGGPLRMASSVTGIYADGWSGRTATYTRYRCRGGELSVLVESDPNLFRRPQEVIARVNGQILAVGRVPRVGRGLFSVPLRPGPVGRCVVRFTITPTAVPGGRDRRRLGTHFLRFTYRPA
jgi:hypothetical protein